MLEILKTIDLVLQTRLIRWVLLLTTITLIILVIYYRIQSYMISIKLSDCKRYNAELDASLALQNAAIQHQGKEYELLYKRLQNANSESEKLSQILKNRVPVKLQGNCDEMVQQVLKEISK